MLPTSEARRGMTEDLPTLPRASVASEVAGCSGRFPQLGLAVRGIIRSTEGRLR